MEFVYKLVDDTDIPFYIGITNNPNARLQQHMAGHTHVQELRRRGITSKMKIIEILDTRKEAEDREKFWILEYTAQGFSLTNIVHVQKAHDTKKVVKPVKLSPSMFKVSTFKEDGAFPPVTGPDLVWLWEPYLQRESENQPGIERSVLIEKFLNTVPLGEIESEFDLELFKVCAECF